MSNRKWYIDEALTSYVRLMGVLPDMTASEVLEALKLESESRRRRSILVRLIGRAVRLNELEYSKKLEDEYIHDKQPRFNPRSKKATPQSAA